MPAGLAGKVQVATPSPFRATLSHPPVKANENTFTVPVGVPSPRLLTRTVAVKLSAEVEGSGAMVTWVTEPWMITVITSVFARVTPPAVAVMVFFPATVELKLKVALPS